VYLLFYDLCLTEESVSGSAYFPLLTAKPLSWKRMDSKHYLQNSKVPSRSRSLFMQISEFKAFLFANRNSDSEKWFNE